MNSGTSCLCLYYYYYYSVMTFYTADRSDISAHAVLLSRLWSSWDGLAREHVDHDHHHRYQCHQLPSPFCSAKLQLRKQRDFLLIDVFLVTSPPSHICSPAQARHHTRACGSCGNMLITLQFLLLHIVHEWKREKKRWRKGSASLKKCVQSSVCVCVCKLFPPTLSLLSDLGLLVHSRDIFLKEKKKWKTSRSGRTDCLVLPLWLLEDWWLPPSWWCQGHAECFCWEWKDLSRHRSSHLWNLSVGMFLCLFIFKFCPVKTRKKKRCWTNSCALFFFFLVVCTVLYLA